MEADYLYAFSRPAGEYYNRKPKLNRQRVAARHRPNTKTMQPKITTRGLLMWWMKRWLPWYLTPELEGCDCPEAETDARCVESNPGSPGRGEGLVLPQRVEH